MPERLPRIKNLPLLISAVTAAAAYWIIFYCFFGDPFDKKVDACFLIFVPVAVPALVVLLLDPRGQLPNGEHIKLGITVTAALALGSFTVLHWIGWFIVPALPIYLLFAVPGAVLTGKLLQRAQLRHS